MPSAGAPVVGASTTGNANPVERRSSVASAVPTAAASAAPGAVKILAERPRVNVTPAAGCALTGAGTMLAYGPAAAALAVAGWAAAAPQPATSAARARTRTACGRAADLVDPVDPDPVELAA